MKPYLWPLAIFVVMLGFLGLGLQLNPRDVPSPLINQPVPAFRLPTLAAPDTLVAPEDLRGQVWLLNVWASWCVACREEHPVLMEFAKTKTLPVIGLDYKDQPADGLKWLARFGDPYDLSVSDQDGRIGINFGVYGVPETFVIDRQGLIRYKHVGPLTAELLRDTLEPLLDRL